MKLLVILCVMAGVVLLIANYIRSERSKYYKWIAKNKAASKYQKMNLSALIKVYKVIGSDNFVWNYRKNSNNVNSLWYKKPKTNPLVFSYWDYYLIDISWFSCVLFKMWENRYSKRQEKLRQEVAICRNATNDVLHDIQGKIENQIQCNYQQIKDAAKQQEQVLLRMKNS